MIIGNLFCGIVLADTPTKTEMQFSDGTKVEIIDTKNNSSLWTVAQIKQKDGSVCYATVGGAADRGAGTAITCVKK